VTLPNVTVFGAIALDVRLTSWHPLVPATSNPVTSRETPGGVGRNVAIAMARLGARVTLASRIGDDAAGATLLADLDGQGIDARHVGRTAGAPTARYWAVLEPSGDLALGLAEMAVLDSLEPAALDPATAVPAAAWFIDANLPAACIDHLLAHRGRPPLVAVDTVSTAKAEKLRGRLAAIDLLFTNQAEAAVLAGTADPEPLLAMGAKAVVMGAGAAGVVVADAAGTARLAALPVRRTDVTGAGDALAATTLVARLAGLELPAAARLGRIAAAAVLEGLPAPTIPGLRELAFRFDKDAHAELARLQP
jgi:pseudouridine kinase